MNNDRRKSLAKIIDAIEVAKADLESIRDEESDYYDNMPESFQQGEKGEAAQANLAQLDEAIESLEAAVDQIGNGQA